MKTSKDCSNKPLISITDGKKLGEVKGVYLDLEMRQVAAVHLGTEGFINRKALAIARSDVPVFGIDAWLVSGSDKVRPLEEIPDSTGFVLVNDLRGREVQTEGGTKLGTIEDVLLDEETHVLGFTLGKVYAQGPLFEKKALVREAVIDLGSKENPMTVILAQAESTPLPSP